MSLPLTLNANRLPAVSCVRDQFNRAQADAAASRFGLRATLPDHTDVASPKPAGHQRFGLAIRDVSRMRRGASQDIETVRVTTCPSRAMRSGTCRWRAHPSEPSPSRSTTPSPECVWLTLHMFDPREFHTASAQSAHTAPAARWRYSSPSRNGSAGLRSMLPFGIGQLSLRIGHCKRHRSLQCIRRFRVGMEQDFNAVPARLQSMRNIGPVAAETVARRQAPVSPFTRTSATVSR